MNTGINVAKVRNIGALYVAESRISQMMKWKGIIAIVAIGNPLFYLIAIGIGVGVLVNQNSGTSGTGGVEYITFIAPALLASAALTGAMDEVMFPVLEGFKWRKLFFAMNATPITGVQIATGVFIAAMLRVAFTVFCYWALLIAFGVFSIGQSWDVIPITMFAAGAFAAVILGITAKVTKEDFFMTILGRLIIMPMFLFSGTFFPLQSMPTFLQPVGWVSPLWHATELGRHFSYGYSISGVMILLHFAYLSALLIGGLTLANRSFTSRLAK
jgi:lipooligosaccharide transport system permease protein